MHLCTYRYVLLSLLTNKTALLYQMETTIDNHNCLKMQIGYCGVPSPSKHIYSITQKPKDQKKPK